jgi:hypothetical protein
VPALFHKFLTNIITIFRGRNLLAHAAAIGLTICLVHFGWDWAYYRATRAGMFAQVALPAIMLGSVVPIFGTLAILALALVCRQRVLATTGWALGQAAILGYLISISYKAWTGRIPPPFRGFRMSAANANSLTDTSHGFQLGFLKGGVFWGWPSSHTTIACAMSVCVITLFPKHKLVVVLAVIYALYVGLAVSVSIHWLSEFVAGAIIGSVIGRVVGASFRTRLP